MPWCPCSVAPSPCGAQPVMQSHALGLPSVAEQLPQQLQRRAGLHHSGPCATRLEQVNVSMLMSEVLCQLQIGKHFSTRCLPKLKNSCTTCFGCGCSIQFLPEMHRSCTTCCGSRQPCLASLPCTTALQPCLTCKEALKCNMPM